MVTHNAVFLDKLAARRIAALAKFVNVPTKRNKVNSIKIAWPWLPGDINITWRRSIHPGPVLNF